MPCSRLSQLDSDPNSFRIVLKPGREKSLRHRHPWIFSGAIERVEGEPGDGRDGRGRRATTAPSSRAPRIARARRSARASGRSIATEAIDAAFLERAARSRRSTRRDALRRGQRRACASCTASPTGCPGWSSTAMPTWSWCSSSRRAPSAGATPGARCSRELTGARAVYERSDVEVRTLEGLAAARGPAAAAASRGRCASSRTASRTRSTSRSGQKTGFFLDQRDNRALAASLARDAEVLNAFCYTGGFSARGAEGRREARRLDRHLGGGARGRARATSR